MQWSEIPTKVSNLYNTFAGWVFNHPVETDILIFGAVVYALVKVIEKRRRRRRKMMRFVWGSWMSREQRQRLQMMRFEDALGDAALDMIMSGEMSSDDEKWWYHFFAEKYNLTGLIPGPLSKATRIKGAMTRIAFYKRLRPVIPGGFPVVKSDPSYKPDVGNKWNGLSRSRYARPMEK